MKYLFEKYEIGERGRIFLGYESIISDSTENALLSVQEKVGDEVVLAQIYINQE